MPRKSVASRCGAPTKTGKSCKNPRDGCRWHSHSAKKTNPSSANPPSRVDWPAIRREFDKLVPSSPDRLDLSQVTTLEPDAPTPDALYRKYYPFMTEWSAKNFARVNADTAALNRIHSDIAAAIKRGWKNPKNADIVKIYKDEGITRKNLIEFYKGDGTGLTLSSHEVKRLLTDGVLVDTDDPVGLIVDLYGQ